MKIFRVLALGAVSLLLCGLVPGRASAIDLDNLNWSVQYMIDNTQTVAGVNQFERPRDNRGLAISPDHRYLYAGYNNPSGGYSVRRIDLTKSDYTEATVSNLVGATRGKAITVDDQGRVYLADADAIKVYSADLSTLQYTISVTKCEGVAVARQGGQLALYSSDRTNGTLTKMLITESGGAVTDAGLDASFGLNGDVALSPDLRGVEVDSAGNIWVADTDDNRVFRVAADGASYDAVNGVTSPMDIGFDGNTALITQYAEVAISRFDATTLLSMGSVVTAPLAAMQLTATPLTGGHGAFSGIAVVPGLGFYVAGEGINTANEKSTYGAIDANSGWLAGQFYTDLHNDDNDPILFAGGAVPEPGSLLALGSGIMGLAGFALRRRRD
jgi:hypothetical protein